jgi:hypothetical protein
VLDAGRVPGVELRFAATDRLVARDWEGAVHVFRIDRRPIGVADLDEIVRCRSPVRFDSARRTLVGVHRPAACR